MGYISGDKTLTSPLNTWSVALCLGVNSGDVATLCQSSNSINSKSARKPIRYKQGNSDYDNYLGILNQEHYKSVNFGMIINSYYNFDGVVQQIRNALDLTNKTKEAKAFYYDCPSENDRTRILDFDGYKHLANDWVVMTFEDHGAINTTNTQLILSFNEAMDTLQGFQTWGAFKELWDANGNCHARFALLLCDKSYNAQYVLPILSEEFFMQQEEPRVTFNTPIAGEFYVYPILIGNMPNSGNYADLKAIDVSVFKNNTTYKFYPLPYGVFTEWKPKASGESSEGGQSPSGDAVSFEVKDVNIETLDVGWYLLKSLNLKVENTTQSSVLVSLAVGNEKGKVKELGNWRLTAEDDAISYEFGEKEEVENSRIQGEKVVLYISFKADNMAWDNKKVTLLGE